MNNYYLEKQKDSVLRSSISEITELIGDLVREIEELEAQNEKLTDRIIELEGELMEKDEMLENLNK
jgi:cell division septum initiation protein DivIVA